MKGRMKNFIFRAVALFALLLPWLGGEIGQAAEQPKIGIAWRADTDSEFFTNVWCAIEQAGGTPVLLAQVKSADLAYEGARLLSIQVDRNDYLKAAGAELVKTNGYEGSNAAEAVAGVQAVIFTGGEDISPTLLAKVEPWHGIPAEKDYNAERDVSDYILMRYCLDKNIPVLGLCRGMQMMSVVCGATVIQDIPSFMALQGKDYAYLHRRQKTTPDEYRDYMPHEVKLVSGSLVGNIFGTLYLEGAPSWHHQAVRSVEGTPLRVTAITMTNAVPMIEAVELPTNTFALGLQFHPEAAIVKMLEAKENRSSFMSFRDSIKVFRELIRAAERNAA